MGRPGTHAGDEPAVLLEVVGLVDRVEGDGCVEVGEDDDEEHLADHIGPLVRREEGGEVEGGRGVDQLGDRRRHRHDRGGEDDRDDAGHVDPERQVGRAARSHLAADHTLRVLDRDPALAFLDEDDRDDDAEDDERQQHDEDLIGVVPPGLDARQDAGDDRGEDQQRDAVADAALGDQLAHPHEQGRTGGEADDDQEHVGRGQVRPTTLSATGGVSELKRKT